MDGGYSSGYHQHLGGLSSSVKMLHTRVQAIHEYLCRVRDGGEPKNYKALRQIKALVSLLRCEQPLALDQAFLTEYNDSLLTVYLAVMTKTSAHIADLLAKFGGRSGLRRKWPML